MDEEGKLLCEAAKSGDSTKVKSLIESGADISYFDDEGLNPLIHGAKHGHHDVVKLLLEAGAPWNALCPSNLSAGDFAMDSGHQEAFELLLNAGKHLLGSGLHLSSRFGELSSKSPSEPLLFV